MKLRILLSLFLAGALYSCSDDSSKTKEELETKKNELNAQIDSVNHYLSLLDTIKSITPLQVAITEIEKSAFQSFVEVYGVVESGSNVLIVPETNGIIESVNVKEGQSVRKGQVLARINTDILSQNLKEMKTSLNLAQDLFDKQKSLYEQNIISEVQYLEAKNRKESLEQSISTIETQISKGIIKAPIDGLIQEILPKKGEMASVQMPFARIIDITDKAYLEADLSEAFFRKINVNDKVKTTFPTLNENIEGTIFYKGNYIDPGNRTFKVHVSLAKNQKGYPPNIMGVLNIPIDSEEDVISVPTNLIQTDGNKPYVFVVEKKEEKWVANKAYITRGITSGERTIVREGLKPKDKMITQAVMAKLKGKGEDILVSFKK